MCHRLLAHKKTYRQPPRAYLSISTGVRWIYIDSFTAEPPVAFSSFCDHPCVTLTGLEGARQWDDVVSAVREYDDEQGPAFIVPDTLSKEKIEPIVVANTVVER